MTVLFCDRCGSPIVEGDVFCDECGSAIDPSRGHITRPAGGLNLRAELLDWLLRIVTLGIGWWVWSVALWRRGQTPAYSLLDLKVMATDKDRVARPTRMALREIVVRRLVIAGLPVMVVLALVATVGQRNLNARWWLALVVAYLTAIVVNNAFALGADRRPLHDRLAWTSVTERR